MMTIRVAPFGFEPGDRGVDLGHRLVVSGGVAAVERPRHFRLRHQRAFVFERTENAAVERARPRALAVQIDDAETLQIGGRRRAGEAWRQAAAPRASTQRKHKAMIRRQFMLLRLSVAMSRITMRLRCSDGLAPITRRFAPARDQAFAASSALTRTSIASTAAFAAASFCGSRERTTTLVLAALFSSMNG